MAAAALAVAVDNSRDDVVGELILERERLAMALADRDSFLAQRHFVVSAQLRRPERLISWKEYWQGRHNDFLYLSFVIRAAYLDFCAGRRAAALDRLRNVVRSEEGAEDTEADEDM